MSHPQVRYTSKTSAASPSPNDSHLTSSTSSTSSTSIHSRGQRAESNRYSSRITQPKSQGASQAMLIAAGLSHDDLSKPQIGIVSVWYEGNPCNVHLLELGSMVKREVRARDEVGLRFNTVGVSDGISMGTEGMSYSLPSRDLIADSIETVMCAQWYDGCVTIAGCDKNMPGCVMGMVRVNRPSLMMYGGTIRAGRGKGGQPLDVISAFQSYGEYISGRITEEERMDIVCHSCPGPGACGGMYTANTMAVAIEALGLSLPYSSSNPAVSDNKEMECVRTASAISHLVKHNITPSQILTKQSFSNALRTVMCLGGSTNAVLHLIAISHTTQQLKVRERQERRAREAEHRREREERGERKEGEDERKEREQREQREESEESVILTLDDFQRMSECTPQISDTKPSGRYVMEDIHRIGGTPSVLKHLLDEGYLYGDCLTVTGKTMRENLECAKDLDFDKQDVIRHIVNNPLHPAGHIKVLYGNLAPEGAVGKITGCEGEYFQGPARVFDSEEEMLEAMERKVIVKGDVIVIRYEGPRGGPGMPEMLTPTSVVMGAGLGSDVALLTDGRFSGGSHGFIIGHISPEAYEGGPLALLKDGDVVRIDARSSHMSIDAVEVTSEEMKQRRSVWTPKPPKATSGTLLKYMRNVSSASLGCVTDL